MRLSRLQFAAIFLGALLATASLVVACPLFAQTSDERCRTPGSGISVDHVVIAVSDMDSAAEDFRSLGFTLTPGRLHPNGLLNAHVKFGDGTALELMSLEGEPTDPVAAAYAKFLRTGEGGAYLAIEADPDRVTEAANILGLPSQLTRSGPFTWVTLEDYDGDSGVEPSPVFFISYLDWPADPDSLLVHDASVIGISSVVLDATGALADLLALMGAAECSVPRGSVAKSLALVGLANAELVLRVESPRRHSRPIVEQVTLLAAPGTLVTQPHVMDEQRTHGVQLILGSTDMPVRTDRFR